MVLRSLDRTRGQGWKVLTLCSQIAPPPSHTPHCPREAVLPQLPAAGAPSKMTSQLPFPRARKEVLHGASQCLDPGLLTKMPLVKNMGVGMGCKMAQ